jgi:hypothetical protein
MSRADADSRHDSQEPLGIRANRYIEQRSTLFKALGVLVSTAVAIATKIW